MKTYLICWDDWIQELHSSQMADGRWQMPSIRYQVSGIRSSDDRYLTCKLPTLQGKQDNEQQR